MNTKAYQDPLLYILSSPHYTRPKQNIDHIHTFFLAPYEEVLHHDITCLGAFVVSRYVSITPPRPRQSNGGRVGDKSCFHRLGLVTPVFETKPHRCKETYCVPFTKELLRTKPLDAIISRGQL